MEQLLSNATEIITDTSKVFEATVIGLSYKGIIIWLPELQKGGCFQDEFDIRGMLLKYTKFDFYDWLKLNNLRNEQCCISYNSASTSTYKSWSYNTIYCVYNATYDPINIPKDIQMSANWMFKDRRPHNAALTKKQSVYNINLTK
jgi:hypothetical protein